MGHCVSREGEGARDRSAQPRGRKPRPLLVPRGRGGCGGGGDASKCERRRDQASGVTVSASSCSGSTQRSSVPVNTGSRPSNFELRTVSLAVATSTTTTGCHTTWSWSPRSKNTAAMPDGKSDNEAASVASASVALAGAIWERRATAAGPASTSATCDGPPIAVRTLASAASGASSPGVHSRFANCEVPASCAVAVGSCPVDCCGCGGSVGKTPSANCAGLPASSRTRAASACWRQDASVQPRSSTAVPASCAFASVPFATERYRFGTGEVNTPGASSASQPVTSRVRAAALCEGRKTGRQSSLLGGAAQLSRASSIRASAAVDCSERANAAGPSPAAFAPWDQCSGVACGQNVSSSLSPGWSSAQETLRCRPCCSCVGPDRSSTCRPRKRAEIGSGCVVAEVGLGRPLSAAARPSAPLRWRVNPAAAFSGAIEVAESRARGRTKLRIERARLGVKQTRSGR